MRLLALYQGVNPLGLFLWLCFDLFQNGSRNDYLVIELGEEVESSNLCQQYLGLVLQTTLKRPSPLALAGLPVQVLPTNN